MPLGGSIHQGTTPRRRVDAASLAKLPGDGSTEPLSERVDAAFSAASRRSSSATGPRRRVGGAPQRRVDAASSREAPQRRVDAASSREAPQRRVFAASLATSRRSSSETGRRGFFDSGRVPRRRIEEGNQRWVGAICLLAHGGTHGGLMNRRWNLATAAYYRLEESWENWGEGSGRVAAYRERGRKNRGDLGAGGSCGGHKIEERPYYRRWISSDRTVAVCDPWQCANNQSGCRNGLTWDRCLLYREP